MKAKIKKTQKKAKTEISKTEIPKMEISKTEIPKTEISKTEIPKTEIPKTEIKTSLKAGIGKQEVEKTEPEKIITTVVKPETEPDQKVVRKERADKGQRRGRGKGKGRDKERFDIPFGIAILGISKIGSLLTKDKKWLTTDKEAEDFEKAINETLGDVLPENIKLSRGVSHLIILTGTYFIDRF